MDYNKIEVNQEVGNVEKDSQHSKPSKPRRRLIPAGLSDFHQRIPASECGVALLSCIFISLPGVLSSQHKNPALQDS